jgi:hypothetical protein
MNEVTAVTTDANGTPTAQPTSKVAAGAITGGALTVLVAMLGAITPELLSFFGPWAPVVFVGIGALATSLASYIKAPTGEIS